MVTVTEQVPAPVRVRIDAVMVQPLLLVAKVIAPVPEPPALAKVTDDPATTTRVLLDTVRVDCAADQVSATVALVLGA